MNKVLNEISYEELPTEKIIADKVETKDKKYQINYTTDKDAVHTLGKRGSKNVLKNEPGLEGAAKRVQTPLEISSLFISGEMLNDPDVVDYTNNLIEKFTADYCEVIENSDKYCFTNLLTS